MCDAMSAVNCDDAQQLKVVGRSTVATIGGAGRLRMFVRHRQFVARRQKPTGDSVHREIGAKCGGRVWFSAGGKQVV